MEIVPVQRLEYLAYSASFKEILSNLALCQDHRPSGKQLETVSYLSLHSSIKSSLTSENIIHFVKNRLKYYLVGSMNDKIRKGYLTKFYKSFLSLKENMIDPCVFLECVLDDSIQELDTHAAFPDAEPNLLLIPTIAKRSAQLKKLKIDFSSLMEHYTMVEKISPMITSLSSLQQLTSLNLYELRESHRSVFKLIGNACPLLTHLSITGFHLLQSDIFSLILGQFGDQLFPENEDPKIWSEDSSIEFLQAPPEILSPFCFTLRRLQLGEAHWDMHTNKCRSVATFVLRHLPLLEKMDGHSTSFGVTNLSDDSWGLNENDTPASENIDSLETAMRDFGRIIATLESRMSIAEQFEKACKELVALRSRSQPAQDSKLTVDESLLNRPTFSGSFSLTSLDFVYPNPRMIRTIPKFCPKLKEVVFWETGVEGRSLEDVDPKELQEQLKAWPKLETITLMKMPLNYVKVILNAFAPNLKHLTFNTCDGINLMDLEPCCQLETLRISSSRLTISDLAESKVDPSRLSPELFLPALKSFESDICLDRWTLWLEGKPELTHIVLNCCHNGTKASIHSDCSSIPKMWPKLELLDIRRWVEMTTITMSNIVPKMSKLKELHLPEKVSKCDPKLAFEILEDLLYRPSSPVLLRFRRSILYTEPCLFLRDADKESEDSDEGVDIYPSDSEFESGDDESEATTETTSSDDDDEISEDGDSNSSTDSS